MNSAKHQLAFFAVAGLLLALMLHPTSTRDVDSIMPRRLVVSAPRHQHLLASPFGTIDQTIFVLPRPAEATIPDFADDRLGNPLALDLAVAASVPSERSERRRPESALPKRLFPPTGERFAKIDPRALGPNPRAEREA